MVWDNKAKWVVVSLSLVVGGVGCKKPEPIGGKIEVEPGVKLSLRNTNGAIVPVQSGYAVVTLKTKPLLLGRNNAVLKVGNDEFNFTIPRKSYTKNRNGSYTINVRSTAKNRVGFNSSVVPTIVDSKYWDGTASCVLTYTLTPVYTFDSDGNMNVSWVSTPVYGSQAVTYVQHSIRDFVEASITSYEGKSLAKFKGEGSMRLETGIAAYLTNCR